ncbi:MAG: SRPBCC family protein [Planctomycetaceae bacterium]|nr:SRPBCC family protein [Planctomycetaceae bacterium]
MKHSHSITATAPIWTSQWLFAAGFYNLVWGASVIVWPHWLFDATGLERMNYPEIWQCVGMIVGVYGLGYLIAATNPRMHWPIVLVGLLGKIFGPIGFAIAMARGVFPPAFGSTILTNDLVWWIPFGMILRDAWRSRALDPKPIDSLQRFVREVHIKAPPTVVFRFHESPKALEKLIPPWENMRVAESAGSLQVGTLVVLKGRVGPVPVRWVARHTEYDPPHLFVDRQESGPFAAWVHCHQFLSDGQGGTILRDEVNYAVPLGILGQWLGDWFVRRKLEVMFAYRHEVTKRLVESGGNSVRPDARALLSKGVT